MNNGSWYINGAPDPRWNDDELHATNRVFRSAFETVYAKPAIGP